MKRTFGLYVAWLVATVMLVLAVTGRHPYGFYTLLRWVCCAAFAFSAFTASEKNRVAWAWIFGVLAALYNPIFRVHLDRSTWIGVNWFTIGAVVIAAVFFWPHPRARLAAKCQCVRPIARTTMTIAEAECILDLVSAALQDKTHPYGQHPVSALQGHDIFDILMALKLRIANEFLQFAHRSDFEEQFSDGLKLYDSVPWQIMRSFVADDQLGQIGARPVMSAVDPTTMQLDRRFSSAETGSSFGGFCKSLGSKEPNYWQHVYERIGIEYTSDSPCGNDPVYQTL